jgi:hypothetical protein
MLTRAVLDLGLVLAHARVGSNCCMGHLIIIKACSTHTALCVIIVHYTP